MIAKWVIAAFLGFSAIFAGELRADPGVTPEMQKHLTAIHDRLQVKLDMKEWQLKERPGDFLRTLEALDSERFYKIFPELIQKCAGSITSISLDSINLWGSNWIAVDTTNPRLLDYLDSIPGECEKINKTVGDTNAAISPRKVIAGHGMIFEKKLNSSQVLRWTDALRSNEFALALDKYGENCQSSLSEVELSNFISYPQGDGRLLRVDATGDPSRMSKALASAASACEKIVKSTTDANDILAPRAIIVSRSMISEKKITPSQVERWATALKAKEFIAAMDQYGEKCHSPIEKIDLSYTFSYPQGDGKILGVPMDGSPATLLRAIRYAAGACEKIISPLSEFNQKVAFDHHLIFNFRVADFAELHMTPGQMLAWIDFFSKKPELLDRYRKIILRDSDSDDYREMKACERGEGSRCEKRALAVNLTTYTGFPRVEFVATLLFFMGDIFISGTVAIDLLIEGHPINLDIRQQPHVPARLK